MKDKTYSMQDFCSAFGIMTLTFRRGCLFPDSIAMKELLVAEKPMIRSQCNRRKQRSLTDTKLTMTIFQNMLIYCNMSSDNYFQTPKFTCTYFFC